MDKLFDPHSQGFPDLIPLGALHAEPPTGRRSFPPDFNPESVRSAKDLPPHLLLGDLSKGYLKMTDLGWEAKWAGEDEGTSLTMAYSRKDPHYDIQDSWRGLRGSFSQYQTSVPIQKALGFAHSSSFKVWDGAAKKEFEDAYRVAYVSHEPKSGCTVGFPDGVFYTVAVPVRVDRLDTIARWVAEVNKSGTFPFPCYARAELVPQAIKVLGEKTVGKLDAGELVRHTIQTTGLPPMSLPGLETRPHGEVMWALERVAFHVCFDVPFSYLRSFVDRLARETDLIQSAPGSNPFLGLQPVVFPVNILATESRLSYWLNPPVEFCVNFMGSNLDRFKKLQRIAQAGQRTLDAVLRQIENAKAAADRVAAPFLRGYSLIKLPQKQ